MTAFDPFAAHAQMKAVRRAALHAALAGRNTEGDHGDEASGRNAGFDGGARMNQPAPVETHEQTLTRLFASGEADISRRPRSR